MRTRLVFGEVPQERIRFLRAKTELHIGVWRPGKPELEGLLMDLNFVRDTFICTCVSGGWTVAGMHGSSLYLTCPHELSVWTCGSDAGFMTMMFRDAGNPLMNFACLNDFRFRRQFLWKDGLANLIWLNGDFMLLRSHR